LAWAGVVGRHSEVGQRGNVTPPMDSTQGRQVDGPHRKRLEVPYVVRQHDGAFFERLCSDKHVAVQGLRRRSYFAGVASHSPQLGGMAPSRGRNGNVRELARKLVESREAPGGAEPEKFPTELVVGQFRNQKGVLVDSPSKPDSDVSVLARVADFARGLRYRAAASRATGTRTKRDRFDASHLPIGFARHILSLPATEHRRDALGAVDLGQHPRSADVLRDGFGTIRTLGRHA
jgi:hypothetical protein